MFGNRRAGCALRSNSRSQTGPLRRSHRRALDGIAAQYVREPLPDAGEGERHRSLAGREEQHADVARANPGGQDCLCLGESIS